MARDGQRGGQDGHCVPEIRFVRRNRQKIADQEIAIEIASIRNVAIEDARKIASTRSMAAKVRVVIREVPQRSTQDRHL